MTKGSLARPDNRLYLGRGGSGKTTLALSHAASFPRVLLSLPDDSEAPPRGFHIIRDRADLVRALMRPAWRVAWIADRRLDLWEWANEAAWLAGDCLVIWEEAGVFMEGIRLAPHAYDLWMRGRHRRLRVFACSQRPARVSRDCTANLARAVIFNTTEPNDLRFYRSMIFEPEAAAAIPRLDFAGHEALDWSPAGWAVKKAPFA
ncbi:MAG TPA: hypothetical protein VMU87_01385 [Stellaceae bacterium]|nr:hypothetical protein [Stellaceae bacterium]